MARVAVDIYPTRQFAALTVLLIGVLGAAYVHVLVLDHGGELFLQTHGATPSKLLAMIQWRHPYVTLSALPDLATSLLLHANWVHLTMNLALLFLFGPSLEDRLGHYRFLLLFFVSGGIAIVSQSLAYPDSHTALVGADGGVAGVAAACLALSPRGHVPTMVRGLEFPWSSGPVFWVASVILVQASLWPFPPNVQVVQMPFLLLAFAAGLGLGPLYRRYRPALLRG